MARPKPDGEVTRDIRAGGTISDTGADRSVLPGDDALPASDLIGRSIDRYRVLARLGEGGMGVVYAALDPALDRKVALKVLPPLPDARRGPLEARLRREAQALAKLDHPNVVGVFDVGVAEESVFVAMQLVEGATLADHVAQTKPSPRVLLELLAAAGRGLAAAHDAGIVHRDVKPSNILVDRSGIPFVGDFGLARGVDEDEPAVTTGGNLLNDQMTRAGAVLGTPLYMSPEQHRGEAATPRSDQFSFCVSAWQLLFGEHPFVAGKWTAALAIAAMHADAVREVPLGGVPARVVRALRRGMRHDPTARWPTIAELARELAPRSRARWIWASAAIAGMAGVALVTAKLAAGPDRANECAVAAERGADVWRTREGEVATAIEAAGLDREGKIVAALAGYARDWQDERLRTCESDDTSSGLRELQALCLDDQLRAFGELVDGLRAAKKPELARAFDIIATLPRHEDCGVAALAVMPAIPARARIGVSDARVKLARARTRLYLGDIDTSRRLFEEVTAATRELGYPPLVAEAAFGHAELLFQLDDPGAGDAAGRAAELATAAHVDRLAAQAYALALVDAANRPDPASIAILTPVARAAASRVGEPGTLAQFDAAAAHGARATARYDDAQRLCEDAQTQVAKLAGVARDEADDDTSACFATLASARGDAAKAVEWSERWLAIKTRRFGADTLATLPAVRELASARNAEGKPEVAVALLRRAVEIGERMLGPDSSALMDDLNTLAQILHHAGKTDDAIAVVRRAVAIIAKIGPRDARTAFLGEMTVAQLFRMLGDADEMNRHYAAALALGERELAADDDQLAMARMIVGTTFSDAGYLDRAEVLIRKAADAWNRTRNARASLANSALGEILEQRDRCAEAVPLFEAAIAGFERNPADHFLVLRTRLHLATCLWDVDRDRAGKLAVAVIKEVGTLGEEAKPLADEVTAWVAVHRPDAPVTSDGKQWANSVRAMSSEFGASSWSGKQALGPPNTFPRGADARTAWAPLTDDGIADMIEVGFGNPERIRAIVVYETFNPGAIESVEIVTAAGRRDTVFRGTAAPIAESSRVWTIEVPCTAEPIAAVKLVLASKRVPGVNQIDAIGAVACK